MRLRVANLGPISKAELEVKPLTIIVGKNQSGKSFLAKMLYTIEHLSEVHEMELNVLKAQPVSKGDSDYYIPTPKIKIENLRLHKQVHPQGLQIIHNSVEPIEQRLSKYLIKTMSWLMTRMHIRELLGQVYGFNNYSDIIRSDYPEMTVETDLNLNFRIAGMNDAKLTDVETVDPLPEYPEIMVEEVGDNLLCRYNGINGALIPKKDLEDDAKLLSMLHDIILHMVSKIIDIDLQPRVHYFPATRSGLLLRRNKIIRDSLVIRQTTLDEFFSDNGKRPRRVRPDQFATYFEREILSALSQEIAEVPEWKHKLLEFFSEQVMGGKIETDDRFIDVIHYVSKGTAYRLNMASSLVSDLAPFYLLVQRTLQKGDMVIIEEPESHLHPGAQLGMAKFLAMLVNSGIRVVVTTHSDYLVGQFSNLIKASHLDDPGELGLDDIQLLTPDQVGIYALVESADGFVLEDIEVNEDGIEEDTFADVVQDLYDETINIDIRLGKEGL